MKWAHRILCIRDRRMALTISAITVRCTDIGPVLAHCPVVTAVLSAGRLGSMGRSVGRGRGAQKARPELLFPQIYVCMCMLRVSLEMRTQLEVEWVSKCSPASAFPETPASASTRAPMCPPMWTQTLCTHKHPQEHRCKLELYNKTH